MFLFKGDRNYISSSDIFNFINKNYAYKHLDIKFHKLLKCQPKISLVKKIKNINKHSIIAKIIEKKAEKFLIFNETKNNIRNNYSYDENLLNKFFKFNSDSIKCSLKTSISYIDLIVSMSKFWHLRNIDKKKIWIVVRINFHNNVINTKYKSLFIKVKKVKNNKNTESEVFINKKLYGKIYYSAG